MNRRLYRCSHDRRLAGVASGLAEYFDIDVTLVRVLWIVSFFFGGFGLLLYIVLAIVVPIEPAQAPGGFATTGAETGEPGLASEPGSAGHRHAGAAMTEAAHRHAGRGGDGPGLGAAFVGLVLILFGALALVDNVIPAWGDGRFLWPAFILGIGALLVATSMRRGSAEQ